jgi:hypothetical protein
MKCIVLTVAWFATILTPCYGKKPFKPPTPPTQPDMQYQCATIRSITFDGVERKNSAWHDPGVNARLYFEIVNNCGICSGSAGNGESVPPLR